jgi:acyl carrier protein
MDRADLKKQLVAMLEDNVGKTFDEVGDDQDLRGGLGLDSIDLVTLVIELQSKFNIVIPSEELTKIQKVGDLLDVMQARLAGPSHQSAA